MFFKKGYFNLGFGLFTKRCEFEYPVYDSYDDMLKDMNKEDILAVVNKTMFDKFRILSYSIERKKVKG
jgi:hypothetical protein